MKNFKQCKYHIYLGIKKLHKTVVWYKSRATVMLLTYPLSMCACVFVHSPKNSLSFISTLSCSHTKFLYTHLSECMRHSCNSVENLLSTITDACGRVVQEKKKENLFTIITLIINIKNYRVVQTQIHFND